MKNSKVNKIIVFLLVAFMLPLNAYAIFAEDSVEKNIIESVEIDNEPEVQDRSSDNEISTIVIGEARLDTDEAPEVEVEPQNEDFDNNYYSTNSEFKGLRPNPVKINTNYDLLREDNVVFPMMFMARSAAPLAANPAIYDLRNLGRLSSVKDQGPNGSCWAFATYSSAESVLLPKESLDFSEKSLRNNHGFDWTPDAGGNLSMATAYLARWSGPVLEKDDPYDVYGYTSPKNLPRAKDLKKVIYFPEKKEALSTQKMIKRAIMDYGAVYSPISYNDYFLNKRTFGHYDTRSSNPNHAITIVGWDDNYSRKNFLTLPPRDGAWLVKNSFGTKWGMGGFYWVSYYDKQIANEAAVFVMGDIVPYQKIYQYDDLGFTTAIGYGETGYFANQYGPTEDDEFLTEVGFYAPSNSSLYEVYVVDDTSSKGLGDGVRIASGSFEYAGYYKIPVQQTKIKSGKKFAVVVKITTPKHRYPIAIEKNIKYYSSKAGANDGEGFVSKDGRNFTDLNKQIKDASVCLKAFTVPKDKLNIDDNEKVKVKSLEITPRIVKMNIDEEFVPNITILPADAGNKELTWSSSDNTIVEVVDGKLHAIGYGEATITATTTDNSFVSDSIRVLVSDEGVEYKASILSQRTTYLQGEEAVFDIRLRDQNNRTLPNKEMTITILTPHNTEMTCDVTTDASGTATMRTLFDKMAPLGKYTIKAIYKGEVVAINLINVKSAKFEPDLSNPVIVTHDILNPRLRPNEDLVFTTNLKDKYERNIRYATCEVILYYGAQEIRRLSKYSDRNGNATFKFDGNLFIHEGNYRLVINGTYGSMDRIPIDVDLVVDDNAPNIMRLNLDVNSDKDSYYAGKENAKISVLVTDEVKRPVPYTNLAVKAIDPEGREYNAKLRTNEKGVANFSINLNNNARPGDFTIEVEATKKGYFEAEGKTKFIVKKDGKYLVAKLSSRKKQYSINEQAYITLNVTDNENLPVRVADVIFTISGPGGTKTELRKRTDYYGQTTMYITPNSYNSEGDYVIEAFVSATDFPSTTTTLAVRFGESVYEGQNLNVTIRNEKDIFYNNEAPKVHFLIENQNNVSVPNASINISIVAPDGQKTVEQVYADDYGKATWMMKKTPIVGTYEIRAEVSKLGYENTITSTKFEVVPVPVIPVINLVAAFDKDVYNNGETIKLAIKASDNDGKAIDNATIVIKNVDNATETFELVTDANGQAVFLYKNTGKIGKYEFNISVTKENHISISKNYAVFVTKEDDTPIVEPAVFKEVTAHEALNLYNSNEARILDLRSKAEYIDERIEKAITYDKNDQFFEQFIKSLNKNDAYIVMLSDEKGIDDLVEKLKASGFTRLYILKGGMKAWKEAKNPTIITNDSRNIIINLDGNATIIKKGDKLVLNLKATDAEGNYLKGLDASIKIQDKIGNNFLTRNIVFDDLGKYNFEFGIGPTLGYGTYKFVIEANKPNYEEGSNAYIFDVGSITKLTNIKTFEDADKEGRFSHIKDKDFAKKYYGKNILADRIYKDANHAKYIYSDLDIESPTFVVYFNSVSGLQNLKKFASVEHVGYNFIAVSAEKDLNSNIDKTLDLIEKEKISSVKSSLYYDTNTEKAGKVLMLDKFGNVLNVFENVDLLEVKGVAKRDLNIEFSTNYVEPDEEVDNKLEAIITIETSKEVYNRGDVVDVFVEMKDAVTKKPISYRNIKYTLRDPKGRVATYMRQTNDLGKHRLRVAVGEKGTFGDYKVIVELLDSRYPNAGAMTGYTVSDGTSVNKKNMKPELKMEKPVKMQGEDYKFILKSKDVEGNIIPFANMTISIKNLNGEVERSYQFMTNDNGLVESSFKVPTTLKPGKYILNITIEASGYKRLSQNVDFEILKNPNINTDDEPEVLETVYMTFDEHDKRGDYSHLTDSQKNQIKSRYGKTLADKKVYNYKNELVEFRTYLDGNKPMIVLLGDYGRSDSNKMWLDFIRNKSDDYNFVCAFVTGSNSQMKSFVDMWKFDNDSDKFLTRGAVLNGIAPNTRPFVMYLDKYGNLVNIYPYQRFDEAINIFEKCVKGTDASTNNIDPADTNDTEKYAEITIVADKTTKVKVLVGELVELPKNPTKDGYNFAGWFTDASCTKEFDPEIIVEGDLTIYAKFVKIETPVDPDPENPTEPETPVTPEPVDPMEPVTPDDGENTEEFKIETSDLIVDPFELKFKNFESIKAAHELANLSENDLYRLERKFANDFGFVPLYQEKLAKVSTIVDGKKSIIMLVGEYDDKDTISMWKDAKAIDRTKFNLVLATGSNNLTQYRNLITNSEFSDYKDNFYRNGYQATYQITREKTPYIVALDRNGKLLNVAPYTRENLKLILESSINSLATSDELNAEGFPVTFNMLDQAHMFDKLSDRSRTQISAKYGTDFSNYIMYKIDGKTVRIKDLFNSNGQKIIVFGEGNIESAIDFKNIQNMLDDHNVCYAISTGGSRELQIIANAFDIELLRGNLYRGGLAAYAKSMLDLKSFIILDKYNRIIYASPYNNVQEIPEVVNKLNGAYAIN
ncbi:MAG: lectin like domain-containing protein [Ezakiella sp.]|nr:lectin like domain-containing protein [Ezakiella sp.]MDD7471900.1 lectin like domain-containing protein [Bacillota bacterium]